MKASLFWIGALCGLPSSPTLAGPQLPIEAFAARPNIAGAAISPNGQHLAIIRAKNGRGYVIVQDRQFARDPQLVMAEPEHWRISWCRFASNTRLLCGLHASVREHSLTYDTSRLVGVDLDGKNLKVLVQNADAAKGQYQDRVLQWSTGIPNTVLIEADEGLDAAQRSLVAGGGQIYGRIGTNALPGVFELNVQTGALKERQRSRPPIRHWRTDAQGEVRLGWGLESAQVSYYARLKGEGDWRRLDRFEAFSRGRHFEPVAISADNPNIAYAVGPSGNVRAIWEIDLTDQAEPKLVYAHPSVDISMPTISEDGRLYAVHYETDRPNDYDVDRPTAAVRAALKAALPDVYSRIISRSTDGQSMIVHSYSDVQPDYYSLLDPQAGKLLRLGGPVASLDPAAMSPMTPIEYPARDGTKIPGYLTLPRGGSATNLPMIVMPHGGPISRDYWHYFFLTQFLANRGYAVLQMNFRGSSGYGSDWFFAAHQDWGGLTYNDVIDGTRWAIREGTADPKRVCIVGWSFGGYLALLGAQQNADLFRCAVDIAGISDLGLLLDESYRFGDGAELRRRQIGSDATKLQHDSPRLHAPDFGIPLLMVHGDHDAQVPIEQSRAMARALKRDSKPYRWVELADADPALSGESDRVTLLRELEAFLSEHLGSAPTGN